jgi:hypothetical protein
MNSSVVSSVPCRGSAVQGPRAGTSGCGGWAQTFLMPSRLVRGYAKHPYEVLASFGGIILRLKQLISYVANKQLKSI